MPDDVIAPAARQQLAVLQPSRLPWNPVFTERYGIDPAAWKALVEAVFPSAKTSDAVALALSYCKARNLDPFKRVVHIVPVWEDGREIETVWPGIAEHRITAMRTGLYAGAEPAQYGTEVERTFTGNTRRGQVKATIRYPEWCQVTLYRLAGGQRVPVPGPRVYFTETYSAIGQSGVPNQRWQRAPFQMLEKCAEAAALRRAFPEELGDHPVAEENRYEADRSPRPQYGRADEPEPQRQIEADREQPGASFAVIDADGEEHEYATPQATGEALALIFADAARRDTAALDAAAENNAATIQQIRTAGHSDIADDLVRQWKALITDSEQRSHVNFVDDPFGLPPVDKEQTSPHEAVEHPGALPPAGIPPRQGEPSPKPADIPWPGPMRPEAAPPGENLTVPLPVRPNAEQLDFFTRQMMVLIGERPLDRQRAAWIKDKNERGLGFLKLRSVKAYDEIMAALNAKEKVA